LLGAGGEPRFTELIKSLCSQQTNLKFIGEINGIEKARYLGEAKAMIFPSQLPEARKLSFTRSFYVWNSSYSVPLLDVFLNISAKKPDLYVIIFQII
jgi:glycosyltransferase involved in cell wall biosynthesis